MTNADAASVPAQPSENPVRTIPFDVSGARAAGYSNDQIVNELQQSGRIPYDFSGALKEGYSSTQILNYLSPGDAQPSGYLDQARQGISDVLSGVAKTLDVHSTPGGTINNAAKWLESRGQGAAPENFVPANLTGQNGKFSNLGLWLARQTPAAGTALGGAVLAAMTAPEDLVAGGTAAALGAGGAGFAMSAGNEAQEAADRAAGKPNAPITPAALARGDLTAATESAVGALPFGRYLPEAGVLAKTGTAGAYSALKKLGLTTGAQGLANAGADVVHQLGQSVGTPQGASVDPSEAIAQGIGGAAVGGLLGSKGFAREALDATKYHKINTPELQQAATQVANRVQQNAPDGQSIQGRLLFSGNAQRAGEAAVAKTGLDIKNEFGTAVSDLQSRVNLPVDAKNVLNSIQAGQHPTESGIETLRQAMGNDPQAANVVNLAHQMHAFDILNESGEHSGGKFKSGLGSIGNNILTGEHAGKTALAALAGVAMESAGHFMHYSPQVIGALAGAKLLGRLSDTITGAQSPAGRFVRNFASPEAGTRLNVPAVTQSPEEQSPFPVRPVAGGLGAMPMIPPALRTQMDARAALGKLQQPQAEPEPAVNPLAWPKNITGPAASIARGAVAVQRMRNQAAAMVPATKAEAPVNPMALPSAITSPAKSIMKGAALAQKLNARATANGANTTTPVPTSVSKATDGTVSANTGNGKRPIAPYSALPTSEAAQRILNDRLAAGIPIENKATYLAKIHSVLGTLREKLSAVAKEAPSIPTAELARFEGVRSQKAATEWRDKLAAEYPAAAPALNKVFSDQAIATQWGTKR